MAEKWQFPESLLYGIRHHHDPSSARKNAGLAAVVNLANAFASKTNEKLPDIHTKSIHPASLEILNLSGDKIAPLQHRVNQLLNVNV
jgi:HD-like signal output (HDOD) protein